MIFYFLFYFFRFVRLNRPHAERLFVSEQARGRTSKGQGSQSVLEDLLEAQELDNRQGDRGVEAQAALVGAERTIELHAVPAVDLDSASIVHPRNLHALG